MPVPEIRTDRLTLRGWADEDRAAYSAINADPAVMATLGPLQTREQTDAHIDRMSAGWTGRGFGLWCVDLDGECIGFTGLNEPWFEEHFTRQAHAAGHPCVEVGWRLASRRWGNGYATEAARAALVFAFDIVGVPEVVSFTSATNTKSRRVMEKLGMTQDPSGGFDHPGVAPGSSLNPHVLYRISAPGSSIVR